jgi:DNA-binding MarR family transcriptional regulator
MEYDVSNMDIPTVALLRLAYHELANEVGAAVRAVAPDQRPSHGSIMEQLDFEDGQRLTDLAEGAGMAPQSAGELVDQLEALGYVERRPDPDDRRAKRIYRTAKAKKASKSAIEAAQKSERELEHLLGKRRLKTLRDDLAHIVEAKGGTMKPPIDGLSTPQAETSPATPDH